MINFVSFSFFFVFLLMNIIANSCITMWDLSMYNLMGYITSGFLVEIFSIITHFADTIIILSLGFVIFAYIYRVKDRTDALFFGFSMILGVILSESLKLIVHKARPVGGYILASGYAFPSGHSLYSMIISLSLFIIYDEHLKSKNKLHRSFVYFLLILFPLLIGFSRIYLNVHWISDVIAGWSLGVFIVTLGVLLIRYFERVN